MQWPVHLEPIGPPSVRSDLGGREGAGASQELVVALGGGSVHAIRSTCVSFAAFAGP